MDFAEGFLTVSKGSTWELERRGQGFGTYVVYFHILL